MANVGKVAVQLEARTSKFSKDMARAQKRVAAFGRGALNVSANVLKMGAAMSAVAIGGAALMVRSQLKAIDANAKLAARIGITTEGLIGLQHAASITGAGSAKLAAGMDVLQKRLGEARMGTGEAKDALELLGLSVDDLIAAGPEEAFKRIAEGVSQLSNQAEKAAVTSKLFSRANQDLVNTLDLGRDGLEDMQREAEKMGITFSRVDAGKIEQANDAVTRLKGIFTGAANLLTIKLAPILTHIADKLFDVGTEGEGLKGIFESVFDGAVNSAAFAAQHIAKPFLQSFNLIQQGLALLDRSANQVTGGIVKTLTKFATETLGIDEAKVGFGIAFALEKQAQTADAKLNDLQKKLDDIDNTDFGQGVKDFFADIERNATRIAQDIVDGTGIGEIADGGASSASSRISDPPQLAARNVRFGFQVNSEQRKDSRHLKLIAENSKRELSTAEQQLAELQKLNAGKAVVLSI